MSEDKLKETYDKHNKHNNYEWDRLIPEEQEFYTLGYNDCLDDIRKQTIIWTYSEEESKDINSLGLYMKFLDEARNKIGVHYDFAYSKTLDWYLRIWRKGVNDDGSDVEIFQDQTCDILDLLSRGCTVLKQYMEEI